MIISNIETAFKENYIIDVITYVVAYIYLASRNKNTCVVKYDL